MQASRILFALALLLPLAASAGGFGQPGIPTQVTRTIHVVADDSMRFTFDASDIHEGDVVRFIVHNAGETRHAFEIGDQATQDARRAARRKAPDAAMDGPDEIVLEPGASKSLIWNFSPLRTHTIVFACNEPDHAEAGMQQRIVILPRGTSANDAKGIN